MEATPLLLAAQAARRNAYAPYSGYRVGAAVLDEQGRIHGGCNVENISYGLTVCAERNALARMVAEGGIKVTAIAVLTEDGGTPCGMCRQALAEFVGDTGSVTVECWDANGGCRSYRLDELLPHRFQSESVARTPDIPEGSN